MLVPQPTAEKTFTTEILDRNFHAYVYLVWVLFFIIKGTLYRARPFSSLGPFHCFPYPIFIQSDIDWFEHIEFCQYITGTAGFRSPRLLP